MFDPSEDQSSPLFEDVQVLDWIDRHDLLPESGISDDDGQPAATVETGLFDDVRGFMDAAARLGRAGGKTRETGDVQEALIAVPVALPFDPPAPSAVEVSGSSLHARPRWRRSPDRLPQLRCDLARSVSTTPVPSGRRRAGGKVRNAPARHPPGSRQIGSDLCRNLLQFSVVEQTSSLAEPHQRRSRFPEVEDV